MRHVEGREGTFAENNGLHDVALKLLKPITDKYCPHYIGHADLWALAANLSIEAYGGPAIKSLFGRQDAVSYHEGVSSASGRLPDGSKGSDHLRDIFWAKGFNDRDIVALSGAHTLGRCHLNRSGFEGPWTDEPLVFDNSYFRDLLSRKWVENVNDGGNSQFNDSKGNMMLPSDMALIDDIEFRHWVEKYAENQSMFFEDFASAWARLITLGYDASKLKEHLELSKL
eukprot:GHVH01000263.1.p1 GENE.GHVH01000263.1~~GHVH01000263.1.p1  ORF type:complete len:227 (+),score=26.91 GHVH01000263.1:239-919(+)